MQFIFLDQDNPPDLSKLKIASERLVLKTISKEYLQPIFTEYTKEVAVYMTPKPADDISETLEFIQSSISKLEQAEDLVLAILLKENEEFLGCIGLHLRKSETTPELGIWLKKSAHGNKYGLEAIAALKSWAEQNIKLDSFYYPADKNNIGSIKIPQAFNGELIDSYSSDRSWNMPLDIVGYRIGKNSICGH